MQINKQTIFKLYLLNIALEDVIFAFVKVKEEEMGAYEQQQAINGALAVGRFAYKKYNFNIFMTRQEIELHTSIFCLMILMILWKMPMSCIVFVSTFLVE